MIIITDPYSVLDEDFAKITRALPDPTKTLNSILLEKQLAELDLVDINLFEEKELSTIEELRIKQMKNKCLQSLQKVKFGEKNDK